MAYQQFDVTGRSRKGPVTTLPEGLDNLYEHRWGAKTTGPVIAAPADAGRADDDGGASVEVSRNALSADRRKAFRSSSIVVAERSRKCGC